MRPDQQKIGFGDVNYITQNVKQAGSLLKRPKRVQICDIISISPRLSSQLECRHHFVIVPFRTSQLVQDYGACADKGYIICPLPRVYCTCSEDYGEQTERSLLAF